MLNVNFLMSNIFMQLHYGSSKVFTYDSQFEYIRLTKQRHADIYC